MNTLNVKTATTESAETWIKTGSLEDHSLTDAEGTDVPILPGRVVSTKHQGYGLGVIETVNGQFVSVVFEQGGRLERISVFSLHGSMWQLYAECVSPDMIERLAIRADAWVAIEKRQRAEQLAERLTERERLRRNAEYRHLKQISGDSAAVVSANVRADIKHHFKKDWPGVKFSVRKSGYDSITVSWTDGPTNENVTAVVRKYKNGSFNSMEDIFEYNESPFNSVFGGVRYISVNRSYSDESVGKAIAVLKNSCDEFISISVITIENYRNGSLYREGLGLFTWGFAGEINRILCESE